MVLLPPGLALAPAGDSDDPPGERKLILSPGVRGEYPSPSPGPRADTGTFVSPSPCPCASPSPSPDADPSPGPDAGEYGSLGGR